MTNVVSIPPRVGQSPTLRTYLKGIHDTFAELDCSNLTPEERDDLYSRYPQICAFVTYPSDAVPESVHRVRDLTRAQRSKLILWLTLSRSRPLMEGAELFLAGRLTVHDPRGLSDLTEGRRVSDIIQKLVKAVIRTPVECT